ncbi:MAG: polyphosphate kinase 2 family protein [Chloroflexi bacterium]|nr:polyphosphate kinase 2 family protein [Chloroflexota bacterium]
MLDTVHYRVPPGTAVFLKSYDPADDGNFTGKDDVEDDLKKNTKKLLELQEKLYAQGKHALLIILQAMDAGGKDSTIAHVMNAFNPQGCSVVGFKAPTAEELAHDFLWRIHQKTPRLGMVTIFNRSHYEDVLVVRVHNLVPAAVWQQRYTSINDFERLVADSGVTILKFFLYISKDEQKKRLQDRIDDPTKHWKFNPQDLKERALWDDYMLAYEAALSKCSTTWAPWYVIPANHNWYRNLLVSTIIRQTMEGMGLEWPPAPDGLEKIKIPD